MLSRIGGAFLALDTEHGIYRDQIRQKTAGKLAVILKAEEGREAARKPVAEIITRLRPGYQLLGGVHTMLIGTFEAVLSCQLDAAVTVQARDTRANFPMPGHALDLYLVVAGRQVKASQASIRCRGRPPQNQAGVVSPSPRNF